MAMDTRERASRSLGEVPGQSSRARLPDLAAEVPEPAPVQVAGLKQPPADAGNPADEAVSRLLAYNGNGNGNH
jgi:hypothetical protein